MRMWAISGIVALVAISGLYFFASHLTDKIEKSTERAKVFETAFLQTNSTLAEVRKSSALLVEITTNSTSRIEELRTFSENSAQSMRREIRNVKTVDINSPVGDAIIPICVQYHKANKRIYANGTAKTNPFSQLPTNAITEKCRRAWARVTWSDLIEWTIPLMEHDGRLQIQLESIGSYYHD